MLRAKGKAFQAEEPACGKTLGGKEFDMLQKLEGESARAGRHL